MVDKDGIIKLKDVQSGEKTMQEYVQDCYIRNSGTDKKGNVITCFRERNGQALCEGCPKQ